MLRAIQTKRLAGLPNLFDKSVQKAGTRMDLELGNDFFVIRDRNRHTPVGDLIADIAKPPFQGIGQHKADPLESIPLQHRLRGAVFQNAADAVAIDGVLNAFCALNIELEAFLPFSQFTGTPGGFLESAVKIGILGFHNVTSSPFRRRGLPAVPGEDSGAPPASPPPSRAGIARPARR